MAELTVENHSIYLITFGDPDGTFYMNIPAGEKVSHDLSEATLDNMREVLGQLDLKEDAEGNKTATIDVVSERYFA